MALPSTAKYGRVVFWGGILGSNFSGDAAPDDRPINGTITFTPSVPVAYVTGSPRPRTVFIEAPTYGLDGEGTLRDGQGNDGVLLLSPESIGRAWTWVATFRDAEGEIALPPVPFHLPVDAVVDLTTAAPVIEDKGVAVTRGMSAYEVAVANGFVGTEAQWLDSLRYTGTNGVVTIPDATATVTGGIRLTNQLGGTATAPTVPGLANKVDTGVYNTGIADAKARANHTGTQSADTVVDGTTNHVFTAADDTKLGGIAAGATANATDAQLRDRATHTGAQAISTVTGLQTALDGKQPAGTYASAATTFTYVTTTSGAYPAARPTGASHVWFDDPAVTPPAWAVARDRWAGA
jgi:hypothetical protein